jgi:hypothetical protein
MLRRTTLTVALVASCLWCLLLVARADSAEDAKASASSAYKPVAPVISLMHAQGHHFGRITDLIGDEKAEDRFEHLRHEALILAELCNINAYRAKETDYRDWAAQARDGLVRFAEAASDHDVGEAKTLAREVQSHCRSCHDKYK